MREVEAVTIEDIEEEEEQEEPGATVEVGDPALTRIASALAEAGKSETSKSLLSLVVFMFPISLPFLFPFVQGVVWLVAKLMIG